MKTSACNCAGAILFLATAILSRAQEAKIPTTPLPNELIGRWLEKTPRHEGDFVGYNIYCFDRQSQFLVLTKVRDEKAGTWVATTKLYPKSRRAISGYVDASSPGTLVFQVAIYAMAVLPVEMRYKVQGNTLVLSRDLFDPTFNRQVHCQRVTTLPDERAEEAAEFARRLESGVNGPDFRRAFESAAREMRPHPSDEEMIANFIEHRDEFEKLRTMMQTDKGLKRVDFSWTQPDDPASVGISPGRIDEYRKLSRALGLEGGVEAFGDSAKRVTFLASTRGLSVSGSSKNYIWLSVPPDKIEEPAPVENLDTFASRKREERRQYFVMHQRTLSESVDALRHLEGNWYLEYEEN